MKWFESRENINEARRLWEKGLPAVEIGTRVGTSGDAIIGYSHRHDWPPHPTRAGIVSGVRTKWATPERCAFLTKYYPSQMTDTAIITRLAALPGTPLPKWKTVRQFANKELGVIRPPMMQRPLAPNHGKRGKQKVRQIGGAPAGNPVGVPLRELVRWGREYGLRGDDCLCPFAVTRAARKAEPGHPGFMVMSAVPQYRREDQDAA